MNNRNIIIGLCIFLSISIFINIFLRNKDICFDNEIIDKTWYNYNASNGQFNTFYINGTTNEITTSLVNTNNEYSFHYNKVKKKIKFDNSEIKIDYTSSNILSLEYNNKNIVFYDNPELAINNIFETYYLKSISEYKKEKTYILGYLKSDIYSIYNNLNSNNYQKIIFQGDNCTSIECTLSLDIYNYWMIKNENILYIDSSNINDIEIYKLKKISNNFSTDINYYNGIYPRIVTMKNNKIIDEYEIKCNGFNCKKYYKIEYK